MSRIALFAGFAALLFFAGASFEALEAVTKGESIALGSFAFDLAESAVFAFAVALSVYVGLELRDLRRDRTRLLNDLARARSERENWRQTARVHLDGLSNAIAHQFQHWCLSEGERDVASLTLKGLSHREIARLRHTSEATVRQQAAAVYRKSGLSSRAELSAFFLEDLLSPLNERPADKRPPLTLISKKD